MLYSDPLVEIDDKGIHLRQYSLVGGTKSITWEDIEQVAHSGRRCGTADCGCTDRVR